MSTAPIADQKVTVMLAGPGHEAVFYQMQPPFLSDARLVISANATQWANFEQNLAQMRPDLVVVQVEIAPGPEALIQVLAEIQVWHGVAILVLPAALRDLRGTFEKASVVRGVYIAPVNWGEIAQSGYAAVMTERARAAATAPLQQAYLSTHEQCHCRHPGGGVYLRLRRHRPLDDRRKPGLRAKRAHERALALDVLRSAAGGWSPLKAALRPQHHGVFRPSWGWLCWHPFKPAKGWMSCWRPKIRWITREQPSIPLPIKSEPDSIYSLVMASWTRNYAAVLLDLPAGEQPWSLQGIAAANTAVIVTRCTLADMAAARHTLVLLLERLIGEHRIPREAIYLVLNQVSDHSPISARGFHDELVDGYGWAPPVAAVIPYNPAISHAQDEQVPSRHAGRGAGQSHPQPGRIPFPRRRPWRLEMAATDTTPKPGLRHSNDTLYLKRQPCLIMETATGKRLSTLYDPAQASGRALTTMP